MISALVSAYFAEEYLPARLENLQIDGVETIVVCQSGSIEDWIARRYPCKVVTTFDVPTLYKAWNLGIAEASGEYLTSANCDDLFYSDGLTAMVKHMDAHGCALVCGDCEKETGSTRQLWHRRDGTPIGWNFNSVGAMPLWRASAHEKYGLFDESMVVSGDYDFWLRLFANGETVCHINDVVGLYRQRENSLEHRNRDIMLAENKRIRERYQDASRTKSQLREAC